ncbi:MAG: hypothetical protein HYX81_04220 [Chloroflexi bacterium]|nr:hypothetical protein [Chloroflexota bacterium]
MKLDDLSIYKKCDPQNILATMLEVPQQCQKAWQMAVAFDLPDDYRMTPPP